MHLVQDVRFSLRSLRKNPWLASVAVVALGLGIASNTTIFSLLNAILLQPLPFPEPDRISMVWLDNRVQGWPEDITSYPNFLYWKSENEVFQTWCLCTNR